MSFDGIFIHQLVKELNETLASGRVSKIQQPYETDLVLVIRSQRTNHKLLLSAHPTYARVQITDMNYQNPETPNNFVQILRKYLEGAILKNISQVENDRILHFHFEKRNELGDLEEVVLISEIMGRHSNILLVNQKEERIMEAIKHVGFTQNTYRTILPGSTYIEPPQQTGENPYTTDDVKIFERLNTAFILDEKFFQSTFLGLGRDSATEIALLFSENKNDKLKTWQNFFKTDRKSVPTLVKIDDKEIFLPFDFSSVVGEKQYFSNLSELLDAFYLDKAEKDRVKQQSSNILAKVKNELKKNKKKIEKLNRTLDDSEHAEKYRIFGELLTTFLAQVPKGEKSVSLQNYYDENGEMVDIPLKVELTPNQNAQKYFQKYQKLKSGAKIVQAQIEQAKEEINYLESVEMQLENATPLEIPIIREELIATHFIKEKKNNRKKTKPSQPERFVSSEGIEILVGKNNLQNDQLTLKTAKKTDLWLHAKNIPGSHVIIKSDHPSDETITEAGILAAFYSKFRHSNLVPVDLIAVKNIRKPNGSKPGFVVYEGQKTILVTPDEEIVKTLKENANV